MVLCVEIIINQTDACKYAGDGYSDLPFLDHTIAVTNNFFIDPRMNDEELSIIMDRVKQYIRYRLADFDFITDNYDQEVDMQKAIYNVLWKSIRVLTEPLPSPSGQLRSVVDLFRDETQSQRPKYEFKANHADVDVRVEIKVVEDMREVWFDTREIVYNMQLLRYAVSDVEYRKRYTVQLISDILASHGHANLEGHIWNLLETRW